MLNFKKESFSFASFGKYFSGFWEKNFRIFFAIFSIAILSVGVYLWYKSVFRSEWSSEEKNQYKNSQNKEIELKEDQFKRVIEEVDRKKAAYEKKAEFAKDIFIPYAGEEPETANKEVIDADTSPKPSAPTF